MRSIHLLAAAGVLGLSAVSAHAAIIDFNYEADGMTPMSNAYAFPANYGAVDGVSISYSNALGWSGGYHSPTIDGIAYAKGSPGSATITFTAPDGKDVELFSFDVGGFGSSTVDLSYYFVVDGSSTATLTTTTNGTIDLSAATIGPVQGHTVEFHFSDVGGADNGIDNINYTVVPEPTTLGVFALGCGALLMARKRKRA